ncbi:MAG: hypothetical protein ACD_51C00206G0007 [uncultured bacterium]|nr:MAG: hypothetical protein ACD_51C00206G0007 [uncultured bacterium]OGJ48084.1 MAG: hypothetical protein A2244_01180 [Candidatus Peregrinibacteria bacterium RIFOXYA2_FULL_41_18]OGJ48259.1 MAG: hypothetical protein A2344_03955 [Candidatus Peregrinibacteria bacterium RIFOXYB12_FULL_41_12]OGJ52928.1 MAG: hypothetical protein A2448_00595 [Candidatus Peregrinibacteria bacterium RIFOXYC2_FULL_41_22]
MADEQSAAQSGGQQSQSGTPSGADAQANHLEQINRLFKEKAVAASAKAMNMNYLNIGTMPINPDYLALIPKEQAQKALVIPFFRIGKKVRVAIAHPTNPETLTIIKGLKEAGYQININLASEEGIKEALQSYEVSTYKEEVGEVENIVDESQIEAYEKEIEGLQQLKQKLTDVTAEEALNLINVGAVKTHASDIHYQPEEKIVNIRFRIDGVLQNIFQMDRKTFEYLTNQLKYKCKMKLNVMSEPQDGRFYFNYNKRKIDVRVSAIPTEYGESFVLRLLDSGKKALDFTDMGYHGKNLDLVNAATGIANGMILVTGPTGSGKTTTLYAMLRRFNKPETKIITLEDPIEYHLENVTQSQVNDKRGYTFGGGLRAILRQDPDIIMIGEIRDMETAETAAQAALTGHVLLSTLHTNSAVETIPRLINIGLQPYMIAPAIHTIIAQRLIRVLCKNCSIKKQITESEKDEIAKVAASIKSVAPDTQVDIPSELYQSVGCPKCSHTGYSGQTCIAEVFAFDDEIKDLILGNKSTHEIFEAARRKGMLTLKEDGVLKVIQGVTTLNEVYRIVE